MIGAPQSARTLSEPWPGLRPRGPRRWESRTPAAATRRSCRPRSRTRSRRARPSPARRSPARALGEPEGRGREVAGVLGAHQLRPAGQRAVEAHDVGPRVEIHQHRPVLGRARNREEVRRRLDVAAAQRVDPAAGSPRRRRRRRRRGRRRRSIVVSEPEPPQPASASSASATSSAGILLSIVSG